MNDIDYKEYVEKNLHKFICIELEEITVEKVKSFVDKIISEKQKEIHHKIDSRNEHKRWFTGFLGECAVEKFIGKKFVDFSIGNSKKYHVPDLKSIGFNCGIKTVEFGKFPIIFKKSFKSEIIVLKKSDSIFYICGLASKEVLNKYQSMSLVLSPFLRKRGTKTGFYGFHKLQSPEIILEYIT